MVQNSSLQEISTVPLDLGGKYVTGDNRKDLHNTLRNTFSPCRVSAGACLAAVYGYRDIGQPQRHETSKHTWQSGKGRT